MVNPIKSVANATKYVASAFTNFIGGGTAANGGQMNDVEYFINRNSGKFAVGSVTLGSVLGMGAGYVVNHTINPLGESPKTTEYNNTPPVNNTPPINNTPINNTPVKVIHNVSAESQTPVTIYTKENDKVGTGMYIAQGETLVPWEVKKNQENWNVIYGKIDPSGQSTLPKNLSKDSTLNYTVKLIDGKKGQVNITSSDPAHNVTYILSASDLRDVNKQAYFIQDMMPALDKQFGKGNYSVVDGNNKTVNASGVHLNYFTEDLKHPEREFYFDSYDASLAGTVKHMIDEAFKSSNASTNEGKEQLKSASNAKKQIDTAIKNGSYDRYIVQTGWENGQLMTKGALKYKVDGKSLVSEPIVLGKTVGKSVKEIKTAYDTGADNITGDDDVTDIDHVNDVKDAQHLPTYGASDFDKAGTLEKTYSMIDEYEAMEPSKVFRIEGKENINKMVNGTNGEFAWVNDMTNESNPANVSYLLLIRTAHEEGADMYMLAMSKSADGTLFPQYQYPINEKQAEAFKKWKNIDTDNLF